MHYSVKLLTYPTNRNTGQFSTRFLAGPHAAFFPFEVSESLFQSAVSFVIGRTGFMVTVELCRKLFPLGLPSPIDSR